MGESKGGIFRLEVGAVDGAEAALAEAERGGEIGSGAAEEGVGEAERRFLGVGVGGGRSGAFLADSAEAEDEEEEAGEGRREAAGEGRQDVAGLVVGRRREEEAAGGHIGNFGGV